MTTDCTEYNSVRLIMPCVYLRRVVCADVCIPGVAAAAAAAAAAGVVELTDPAMNAVDCWQRLRLHRPLATGFRTKMMRMTSMSN